MIGRILRFILENWNNHTLLIINIFLIKLVIHSNNVMASYDECVRSDAFRII